MKMDAKKDIPDNSWYHKLVKWTILHAIIKPFFFLHYNALVNSQTLILPRHLSRASGVRMSTK